VFEPDIPRVDQARSGWFTLEGYDEPFAIDETTARLVTVGRVVDPRSRTVPVIFDLVNPAEKLRVGQFAKVDIATGPPVKAVAIPESALIEEGGKPFVFVQVEGEAFERRPLVIRLRSRGWVQITEGVKAGERVVTRGAYDIKLASASGAIPAHGHAH
jgi:multidrug efflux pump subunit AcrA (membrane-fusion protein)